jgi:ribosomal protein S6E (S10)
VAGQVFDGLLALEGEGAVAFVAGFLKGADEAVCAEAALSLGSSRLEAVVEALIAGYEQTRDPERRQAAVRGLSVSRSGRALDFLLGIVSDGSARDARSAIEALSVHRESQEIRKRVAAAADGREPEVRAALNW